MTELIFIFLKSLFYLFSVDFCSNFILSWTRLVLSNRSLVNSDIMRTEMRRKFVGAAREKKMMYSEGTDTERKRSSERRSSVRSSLSSSGGFSHLTPCCGSTVSTLREKVSVNLLTSNHISASQHLLLLLLHLSEWLIVFTSVK